MVHGFSSRDRMPNEKVEAECVMKGSRKADGRESLDMSGVCLLQKILEHACLLPWIETVGERGGGDVESGDTQVLEQVREMASRPQVEG